MNTQAVPDTKDFIEVDQQFIWL